MLTMKCWIPEPLTFRQYSIASRVLIPPCRRSIDRGSLDFLEPSADRIAMPAQHIECPTLHGGIFTCIESTCVGILGHKRQRPFFTGAADHDWWMRLGDRQRRTKRFGQSIMLPHIERTFPDHICNAIWTVSSRRSKRSFNGGNGTPSATASCSYQPAPTPKYVRPPESTSRVVIVFTKIPAYR